MNKTVTFMLWPKNVLQLFLLFDNIPKLLQLIELCKKDRYHLLKHKYEYD